MQGTSGIDQYGFPINAPIAQGTPKIVPWKLGVLQGIQQQNLKTGRANIKDFVLHTVTNKILGTVANAGTLKISSYLTGQAPHLLDPTFAQAYIAIYLGTTNTQGSQLFPIMGTGITASQWGIQGGFDLDGRNTSQGTTYDGTLSVWSGQVVNSSGAQATISTYVAWKYLQFTSGTVA